MQKYSVALCTYNGSKYVEDQLNSITNQSVPPSQIVVSDDGSKDETLQIVDTYLKSKGIDYIIVKNGDPHGVTFNFQNAFKFCKYPIIFTSDQDDIWMKDKAEKMLYEYEKDPKAMLVFSDGELVDGNLNKMNCTIWKAVGITPERIVEADWFNYLLKNCLVTGAEMSFKKELLNDIDSIPGEWLHDGWLTWAAVIKKGLRPCPYKLILYRQHGSNVVGMSPTYAIGSKIKHWLGNFNRMKHQRDIRYKRYLALQSKWGHRFSTSQQEALSECVDMWRTLSSNNDASMLVQLRNIFYCLKHGYYHKYFVGFRGFARDFVMALISSK